MGDAGRTGNIARIRILEAIIADRTELCARFSGSGLHVYDRGKRWLPYHTYSVHGDAWEATMSDSPLNEPGLNIHEGDTLLAIGGHRVGRTTVSLGELLVNLAGQEVQATFQRRRTMVRNVLSPLKCSGANGS